MVHIKEMLQTKIKLDNNPLLASQVEKAGTFDSLRRNLYFINDVLFAVLKTSKRILFKETYKNLPTR